MAPTVDPQILAERVRSALPPGHAVERRMFGGITFLVNGNMLCCASKSGLMVRIGTAAEPAALSDPMARRCTGAGRPMAGFILVDPRGVADDESLIRWLRMARAYVDPMPEKAGRRRARTGRRTVGT